MIFLEKNNVFLLKIVNKISLIVKKSNNLFSIKRHCLLIGFILREFKFKYHPAYTK